MYDRSISVTSAVALLASVGGIDLGVTYANFSDYTNDMRRQRRAAFERKDYKMVEMLQADIAKTVEIIDALELAMIEA